MLNHNEYRGKAIAQRQEKVEVARQPFLAGLNGVYEERHSRINPNKAVRIVTQRESG